MLALARVALTLLAGILNALFDTPHEPESRPDAFEVCWYEDGSAAWLEQATPTGFVCDGTGRQWFRILVDNQD